MLKTISSNFIRSRRFYYIPVNYKNSYEKLYMNNTTQNDLAHFFKKNTISVLGYGPQGRAQALNLRDNRLDVILGLRKNGKSWKHAQEDGWTIGKNLFEIDEAAHRGIIIKYLLSDVGQIKQWKNIREFLYNNDILYFSHGFCINYKKYTDVEPPSNINVVMVAPKCSGHTVRKNFKNKKGFMSSFAIYQNIESSKIITEKTKMIGYAIGSDSLFKTTFDNEVKSDLTGERCVLMGMIQGAFLAQYNVLRENGHSPLEAYNETIEEALNSLFPIINDNGMDWLYKNCSTTAQRGALDWAPKFEEALKPIVKECYENVDNETEVKRLVECSNDPEYETKLENELNELSQQEMWMIKKQINSIKKNKSNINNNIFLL